MSIRMQTFSYFLFTLYVREAFSLKKLKGHLKTTLNPVVRSQKLEVIFFFNIHVNLI